MSFQDPYLPEMAAWSREELQQWQWQRLQDLLQRAYQNNPFYRKRMDGAGVKPEQIRSFADFSQAVPFVTKKDMLADQQIEPPYGQRLGIPPSDLRQVHLTSGTSGIGQEVYGLTAEDMNLEGRGWIIHMAMMGLGAGDVCALTWPVATMAAAHNVVEASRYLGVNLMMLGIYDSETKLKFMKTFPPHYLIATPTYLLRLAVMCQEAGLSPHRHFSILKGITIAAEPYPVEWAEQISTFWPAPIHEMYGSTQSGTLLGSTCAAGIMKDGKRGSLHLMEHLTYVEVIDPSTGEAVGHGEEGEMVITSLLRQASPIIRFRMGDRVRIFPHDDCSCGSCFDYLEAGTIGRYDDMIKIKAANVWPQAVDDVVFANHEIEEYNGQVFIDEQGREQVRLQVEFSKETSEARRKIVLGQMKGELKQRTQVSMQVAEVPYGTLERATFKSRRWSDQRKENLKQVIKFTEKV